MDNLTHSLLGAVLSHAGLNRRLQFGKDLTAERCDLGAECQTAILKSHFGGVTALLVIASNLPDIEAFTTLVNPLTYLEHHRGYTHTLWGAALLALLLPLPFLKWNRRIKTFPASFAARYRYLFVLTLIGTLSHLFLDFTNSYGVRPIRPFSQQWVYGDFVAIVDPWISMILGSAAFLIMARSRLGSRLGRAPRLLAVCALAALSAYYALCWQMHQVAVRQVRLKIVPELRQVIRPQVSALAVPGNPFLWTFVIETRETYRSGLIAIAGADRPTSSAVVPKNLNGVPFDHVRSTCAGKVMMRFARFPYLRYRATQEGWAVLLSDLRFAPTGGRIGFGSIAVYFDKEWRELPEGRGPCPWSEAIH